MHLNKTDLRYAFLEPHTYELLSYNIGNLVMVHDLIVTLNVKGYIFLCVVALVASRQLLIIRYTLLHRYYLIEIDFNVTFQLVIKIRSDELLIKQNMMCNTNYLPKTGLRIGSNCYTALDDKR
jgi:hypothetical protein